MPDKDDVNQPLLKDEASADLDREALVPPRQPRRLLRWLAGAIVAFVVIEAAVVNHVRPDSASLAGNLNTCAPPDAVSIKAPRTNLWKNLSVKEAVDLKKWLSDPARSLNLTDSELALDTDNFIHLVENYPPPKASALAHLHDPKEVVDRYARAIINHGPAEKIVDYLVGPLPPSNKTTIRPLTEIYHAPIPHNARTTFNYAVLAEMIVDMLSPVDDITRDLFNVSALDGTVSVSATMPLSYDGTWRRTWVQLKRNVPGGWLHPLDFNFLVDMTGTDVSKYHILVYVHNGKMYRGVDELRAAFERGELRRMEDWDGSDWATRAIKGKRRDLDDRAGPRTVQSDGARYRADVDEGYVTWMGWSMYLSFERDMGLHLWDIRFKDERIIYELAPQEAMAQYSGSDPHQASTVWLDRAFGMGGNVREVILGYDCPHHALLLNATVHEMGSSNRRNAICVFEREAGRPLSRHTGKAKNEMGAVKGYELVVRTVSTVGNYDYIFDQVFGLDGTIEVRVSASGYLQGGVWNDKQAPYGHQLRPGSMGSLHDHIINYKIDFDVLGTNNSFMKVSLEQEKLAEEWFEVDGWGPVTQTKIVRTHVEEEALFQYQANMEGAYVVVNEDEHNAWGNPRGYALHPGPLCRLTNLDAKRTENSVNWAKHHLAVSRRHDNEPSSSSMWNGNLPGAPPVNFYKFFNNESLAQQDLVVWVNLGTHHLPRAEDAPNTLTNVATSYILLVPWNFNDNDASLDSRNSVLLNNDGKAWKIEEAARQPHCVVPPEPRLTYTGLEAWRDDGTPYSPVEIGELRTHAEAIHAFGM